jgi:hypothetical protein
MYYFVHVTCSAAIFQSGTFSRLVQRYYRLALRTYPAKFDALCNNTVILYAEKLEGHPLSAVRDIFSRRPTRPTHHQYLWVVQGATLGPVQIPNSSTRNLDKSFMRSALFWDITRRCVVNNYHTTPGNILKERRSHQHRGGSLKSR